MRIGVSLLLGLFLLSSADGQVELTVDNSHDAELKNALVTGGVPFKKGELKDVSGLGVQFNGKGVPAQFRTTALWDDGSARWVLVHTQIPIGSKGSAELSLSTQSNPSPSSPVEIKNNDDAIAVSTGPLALLMNKKKPGFVHSLRVDGKELLTGAGKGVVLVTEDGKTVQGSAPSEVIIEESGPMRAVVCLKGGFPGVHKDMLKYTARLYLYAGRKVVKTHFWLENYGADGHGKDAKPEWFAFEAMGLDFGLGLGDSITAECEGVKGSGAFKVFQSCERGDKKPYFTYDNFTYQVTHNGEALKTGKQTDGLVRLTGDNGSLNVGIRNFWQNYQKAIEKDGKHLMVWLWPEGGQWPRTKAYTYRIRRLKGIIKEGKYLLPGSAQKGHEFILDFSGGSLEKTAADLDGPIFPRAEGKYYTSTEAIPEFFVGERITTGNKFCDFKLRNCLNMSSRAFNPEAPDSIYQARKETKTFHIGSYHVNQNYWYGWMDFGDISLYGVGQISLSSDWPLLAMFEYLRNGDPGAWRMARQMAHHRIDVDQYWSDRDPPIMNGVQSGNVWPSHHANGRGGGYAPGGTFIAGPALWHMLTGEPKAKEASLRSAEGLVRAWKIINKKKVYGGGRKADMAQNGWTINSFCAAYELTADKRWLDEAMKLFDANVVPKWKSLGPHLHSPGKGQIRGQSYIGEDRKYCHAIGPLCNLHRLTGNEKVLELLTAGCEKELSSSTFYDAPVFLAGLYSYVGAVADNAEFMKTAVKKFALGFPESKNPPIFMPENKTWAGRAAMMMRAGAIMEYGFLKAAQKD